MSTPDPRDLPTRVAVARHRLRNSSQLWLASSSNDGPHLIPLAFICTGEHLLIASSSASRTMRNLRHNRHTRLALGTTMDVVMIDADVSSFVEPGDLPADSADRFATVSHDPREMPGYEYAWLKPVRIQVWNGFHEFAGRTVMHNGEWLTTPVD